MKVYTHMDDGGAWQCRVEQVEAEVEQLKAERDNYRDAMRNHLCQYDMADWLVCAGGHGEDCAICAENDKGQHRHALLKRAEQAEAQLATAREALEEVAEESWERCVVCKADYAVRPGTRATTPWGIFVPAKYHICRRCVDAGREARRRDEGTR